MSFKEERKINYRELQAVAKKMNLPGNLKYHLLLEIIEARRKGQEHIVQRILSEQKLERVRRKNEKLEAREAAYQYLRMTQERKPTSKFRKLQVLPETVTQPPERQSWSSQTSSPDSYIRSLLSMPRGSFQELLKQSKEQELVRARASRPERPFFYNQITDNVVQPRMIINEHNDNLVEEDPLQPFFVPGRMDTDIRDRSLNNLMEQYENKAALLPFGSKHPDILNKCFYDTRAQEERTSSWQVSFNEMRDLLSQNEVNWSVPSFGPAYYGEALDVSQLTADVVSIPQELQHYSFINGTDYWKNVYIEQDAYRRSYADPPCNSSSYYGACPSPNSDTLSATGQDVYEDQHQHETVYSDYRNNNHVSYSLPYLATDQPTAVEYPDSLLQNVSGCSTIEDTSLQNQHIPMDRDVRLLSVVGRREWTCEISSSARSKYVRSVSSYVQLN